MNGERLFFLIGLVDDDLVEEAEQVPAPVRRIPWRRWATAAACVAVVALSSLTIGSFRGCGASAPGEEAAPGEGAASGGIDAGEPGHGAATAFLSYAGPVLPLTTAEAAEGLTAARSLTWDFAPGAYADGTKNQWGARVTDAYTLSNAAPADASVTALYPFAGSLRELAELRPAVSVNGETVETALHIGPYAGGFRDAGEDDGSTWNLAPLTDWEGYAALLADGAYQARALADRAAPTEPVTVYEFSHFQAPHETHPAAAQAVSFTLDPEATTVLTYGFNGMEQGEDGFRRYSYFVPDGTVREPETKLLLVLGEDLTDYTLSGYADGGCNDGEELDGVSCAVTRTETTLGEALERACQAHIGFYTSKGAEPGPFDQLSLEDFTAAAAELLTQYGPLSGQGADRYGDGRLDDLLDDVLGQDRVCYLSFPVTVPAGGTAAVEASLWKEPSFDFGCSGTGNEGLQGYDLSTRLGSVLDFTAQTAALVNAAGVELVRQDLGFDLEQGVTEVALDLQAPHFFLEVRLPEK